MARRSKREEQVHRAVAMYIKRQYPTVIFNSDMSGVKLSKAQAGISKSLRSDHKFPDLVIYEQSSTFKPTPSGFMEEYCRALFVELKAEGTQLYQVRDPEKYANKHIEEQARTLEELRKKGYAAEFAVGFDEARKLIDKYLGGKLKTGFGPGVGLKSMPLWK